MSEQACPNPERHADKIRCLKCGYSVLSQVLRRTWTRPECGSAITRVDPEPFETLLMRWELTVGRRGKC